MNIEQVTFREHDHKYFSVEGKELISTSTLVSLYKPVFDPTGAILARCAEKEGKTIEELQAEWDKKRIDAADRGTSFHKQAEEWVKTRQAPTGTDKDIVEQLTKFKFRGRIHAETIVAASSLGIAGTVDLIDEYGNNELDVWDYKTNKELKKKGFFDRKTRRFSKMLYPISHLDDCNFIHYSLQQEIYAIILEENGYWVNDKTLLYINPKTREIERHPVMSLRKEALTIINHYKNRGKPKANVALDPFDF